MKKFSKYIEEMSMSVTLKPKKNNMYKVTGVGKKMAAHGGIKKGEKFHDSEIDGMHDSGIKVKYEKPKPMRKEAIERRADRKTIIATDPATGRKVVKIAPKKEIDIGKGKMEAVEPVNEISDKVKTNYIKKANLDISDKEKIGLLLNKPSSTMKKDTMKRREGVRLAKSKLGEENIQELDTKTLANYQRKAGAQYKQAKVDSDERTAYKPFSIKGGRAADAAERLKNKRGKGLAQSKKVLDKRYSDKQVKMGKGVAFDKRYKGGNMTGASKAINKIKPGLADHPKVANALRRANEEFKGE